MARRIDWRDMPDILAAEDAKVKRAAAKTLNALAYDSLPVIVERAERALDFQFNAKRALGMRVIKRARNDSLFAQIGTGRGWLFYHLNSGRRGPKQGFRFDGQRYLVYPLRAEFTYKSGKRRGTLKESLMKRAFAMKTRSGAVLVHRPRGGEMQVIAVLSRTFRFQKALAPEDVVAELMRSKGTRLFKLFMDRV